MALLSPSIAKMADEAVPNGVVPPGYEVIAGYIGGPEAFHTWTADQWAAFKGVKKLPIFVPNIAVPGKGNPGAETEGWQVLASLYRLKVPKGSPVALDLETVVNGTYVSSFQKLLNWAGYFVWVYGSASTVFGNPPANGYWVADFTGSPFMFNHAKVRATQYASGNQFDSSLVKGWQYVHRLKRW